MSRKEAWLLAVVSCASMFALWLSITLQGDNDGTTCIEEPGILPINKGAG